MKIECRTLFDISVTGVTGHYRSARVPFEDRAGQQITDLDSWNRARNQQRNWETVNQIIGMRTQVESTVPEREGSSWSFEFETETPGVYVTDAEPVAVLSSDADGVPMLTDLDNRRELASVVVTSGPRQNIWFSPLTVNK